MRTALGSRSHVNPSTIFILFCETRQAINKYMLGPACFLLEHFARSASVQTLVARRRADLQHNDDDSMPHTLQLLEIIRNDLGMTIEVSQPSLTLRTYLAVFVYFTVFAIMPTVS